MCLLGASSIYMLIRANKQVYDRLDGICAKWNWSDS